MALSADAKQRYGTSGPLKLLELKSLNQIVSVHFLQEQSGTSATSW